MRFLPVYFLLVGATQACPHEELETITFTSCIDGHSTKRSKGGIDLEESLASPKEHRSVWERALAQIDARAMPAARRHSNGDPISAPGLDAEERAEFETALASAVGSAATIPGGRRFSAWHARSSGAFTGTSLACGCSRQAASPAEPRVRLETELHIRDVSPLQPAPHKACRLPLGPLLPIRDTLASKTRSLDVLSTLRLMERRGV